MGCVSSKKARSQSPAYDVVISSGRSSKRSGRLVPSGPLHVGPLEKIKDDPAKEVGSEREEGDEESGKEKRHGFDDQSENLRALKRGASQKKPVSSIKFAEGEHVAAGWPAWLLAVAGEAIDGWVPLRSDMYERLEKIGQGTYSTVYRARDLKTGKMVAVKKVRFDNFQPESVRFMAREILILRKLDHPNIMKLKGIITSRLSCSIYLVFDYMEHDLAGLLSCPDIKFTDSQIKCYMQQLLSGLEHCHSRGIMHRDIKSSNILVNNEGILKIADFGLANFMRPKNKLPLTSRVVTLWYRPPELLLGSTNYGETVDLWSVASSLPPQVEQLHKIFRLCGSPQDDYWKKSRLPLASMFKPQQPYESTLHERCKEFPKSAVSLIETFLSVEPYKRGTASSGLNSEYFNTKPYACDPSSLPKYPPNKEIDAKTRDDARRKKGGPRAEAGPRNPRRVRKTVQEASEFCKVIPTDQEAEGNSQFARRAHGGTANMHRRKGGFESRPSLKQYDTKSEASQMTQESNRTSIHSVPAEVTASSGFAWAKRQKQQDVFTRLHSQPISRNQKSYAADPSSILRVNDVLGSDGQDNDESSGQVYGAESAKRAKKREIVQSHRPDLFDSYDVYESQDLPEDYGNKKKGRVAFSGPMTYQPQEIASRQSEQPHQAHHRSRFYKVMLHFLQISGINVPNTWMKNDDA
ncbi:probable serine/threonine-protein kinase at1g54610 [Phtheirospermum japonicum]|uniref:Probable serine/threonine-protein kinase at1g54610 n=1 Tax=Phtheirospermum japonicum TaxID=374723 RepID=A0A830C0S3_9LAMI|nr:probable serine/threonine-protein kinase at1g54610 [Phtheirospermum japonicum]